MELKKIRNNFGLTIIQPGKMHLSIDFDDIMNYNDITMLSYNGSVVATMPTKYFTGKLRKFSGGRGVDSDGVKTVLYMIELE